MEDTSKLCFCCMRPKEGDGKCPHCGSEGKPEQKAPLLELGTTLSSRYVLGKAGRKNSEGITYIAYDTKTGEPCSVREFFPESLCARAEDGVAAVPAPGSEEAYLECRATFIELWKKLLRLRGLTSLIEVTDVFTADNTAYAVFSETEERTLRDYLLETPEGSVEWDQARVLFMPVLSTLGTLHTSGVIHKGINPSAFLFTEDGKLKLTDFSIHQARLAFSDLESDIEDGYAPVEIYEEDGDVGPWTDVYSFCAVLFRALVGSTPISAPVRRQNDQMMIPAKYAEKLPPYVINSLINGMQIEVADRTRNVEQLRANLSASPRAVSASVKPLYRRAAIDDGVREAPSGVSPSGAAAAAAAAASASAKPVISYQTDVSRTSIERESKPAARRPVRLIDDISDDEEPGARTKVLPKTGVVSHRKKDVDPVEVLAQQKKLASRRKWLTVLLVLLVLLMFVGLGYLAKVLFGGSGELPSTSTTAPNASSVSQQGGNLPETVQIPEFRNHYYDQIANDNYYSKLLDIIAVYENSASVANGLVINQSIAAGNTVTRGTKITLTVSIGPKQFQMPNVIGYTEEQAIALLCTQNGLEMSKQSKYNDGTHVPDTVAETLPVAGATVSQGDRVIVSFWGPMPTVSPDTTVPGETAPGFTVPDTTAAETPAQ